MEERGGGGSVEDPNLSFHFDAGPDLDPNFHNDADQNPSFPFDADPDPDLAPHQNDANLRSLDYPPRLLFEPLRLHCYC